MHFPTFPVYHALPTDPRWPEGYDPETGAGQVARVVRVCLSAFDLYAKTAGKVIIQRL